MFRSIRNLFLALLVSAIALPLAAGPMAKIDLNKASVEQLESLPRIGPAVARRIVEYREQNGGFRKVEELVQVRGIGDKTFAELRDLVTVAAPADAKDAAKDSAK